MLTFKLTRNDCHCLQIYCYAASCGQLSKHFHSRREWRRTWRKRKEKSHPGVCLPSLSFLLSLNFYLLRIPWWDAVKKEGKRKRERQEMGCNESIVRPTDKWFLSFIPLPVVMSFLSLSLLYSFLFLSFPSFLILISSCLFLSSPLSFTGLALDYFKLPLGWQ